MSNSKFFKTLILILIPTLIFFANIKDSKAAPISSDLAASINSAFNSNAMYPLTNQQILDNGCRKITSELVQNTDDLPLHTSADLLNDIKAHKTILTAQQNLILPVLTTLQNKINVATATTDIDYNELNGLIDEYYDSIIDITDPVQISNNNLYGTFDKLGDVTREVTGPELDYYIGNQDYSIEYIYNSLDVVQEDINNDLTKDFYTKAEANLVFEEIKFYIEDEFLNMQDRTDEIITELESGFGTIKDVFVNMDEECTFIFNDVLGLEGTVIVPIIKQYVCDSLYLADASNVQFNGGNCLVYK